MIKLLIGGSPCTYWSIAQKNNRETQASGMGWELFKNYLVAKEKFKPDFFLYENNKSAAQPIKDQIKQEFGVTDGYQLDLFTEDNGSRYIEIDSALVSAQSRKRFYVHNCGEVKQPEDRGILLKDILISGVVDKEKAYCLKHQAGNTRDYFKKHHTQVAFEPVRIGTIENKLKNPEHDSKQYRVYSCDGKSTTLCGSPGGQGKNTGLYATPINITEDGKSQTIKAQYHKNNVSNFCCYNGTYGATGVAIRIPEYSEQDKARPLNAHYSNNSGCGEGSLEGRMFCGNKSKQQVDLIAEPVGTTKDGKAFALTTYYSGGQNVPHTLKMHISSMVAEPVGIGYRGRMHEGKLEKQYEAREDEKSNALTTATTDSMVAEPMIVEEATKQGFCEIKPGECVDLAHEGSKTRRGRSMKDKCNCLNTQSMEMYQYLGTVDRPIYEVRDGQIKIKDKWYPIKLKDGYYIIRKLSVAECCRLQTLPDDYCRAVSDTQAYKGLGNGWTAEVIIHILNCALKDVPRDEEIVVLSMYDGIGTGRYCLDKMGFKNVKYYAYEIDKYAMQVAQSNYPDIIECGDAFQVLEDDWDLKY